MGKTAIKKRIAEVRGLRNKYYDASDQLETMLAKDQTAMALKIISITSGFALLDRYEELADKSQPNPHTKEEKQLETYIVTDAIQ